MVFALIAAGVPALSAAPAACQDSGPLTFPIQQPLWMLHGSLPADGPETAAPGELQPQAIFSWSSTFDRKARAYRFDEETAVADLSAAYGLSAGIEGGIHLPLISRGGGMMDSFIEKWHDLFHLPNGGRNYFAQDQYEITGDYNDGSKAALGSSGSGIANPDIWTKIELAELRYLGMAALKLDASLPLSTESFGHEGTDIGAQLLGGGPALGADWSWGCGYMYLADSRIEGIRYRDNLFSAFFGAGYTLFEHLDLKSSLLFSTSPLHGIENYPDYAVYLDLGLRWQFEKTALELLLREDPAGRASSDISFVIGLSSRLPL